MPVHGQRRENERLLGGLRGPAKPVASRIGWIREIDSRKWQARSSGVDRSRRRWIVAGEMPAERDCGRDRVSGDKALNGIRRRRSGGKRSVQAAIASLGSMEPRNGDKSEDPAAQLRPPIHPGGSPGSGLGLQWRFGFGWGEGEAAR
jgi:hypothetical protein